MVEPNTYSLETDYVEGEHQFRPPVSIEMDCRKIRKSIRFQHDVAPEDLAGFVIADQLETLSDLRRFPKGLVEREAPKPVANSWFNCIAQVLIADLLAVRYFQALQGISTVAIRTSGYSVIIPTCTLPDVDQLLERSALDAGTPHAYTLEYRPKVFLNQAAADLAQHHALQGLVFLPVDEVVRVGLIRP